ncbi:hypothetical protein EPO15_00245 [bacterium]|nr:MAG: hypothetical protein EPO15_00245 [bacterium]
MPLHAALLLSAFLVRPAGAQESPYAARAVKVLSDHRFEAAPWIPVQAGLIKNRFGLEAYRVLAENYTTVTQEVLAYCNEIDNPLALEAFKALADRYSLLMPWQVRWAGEVNTPRELAAYRAVVAGRHTEREEAEAALLDGLKAESDQLAERRWSLRRSRLFRDVLERALAGIPGTCRMRLSGAEVRVHDMPGLELPAATVARYSAPVAAPDAGSCGGRPGRLNVYMAPFLATHAEDDARSLGELVMREVGCRSARPRQAPAPLLARADDLRDALGPLPRKKTTARSCAVRRYQKPRIVSLDVAESVLKSAGSAELAAGDLSRVADPAAPPETAPAAH